VFGRKGDPIGRRGVHVRVVSLCVGGGCLSLCCVDVLYGRLAGSWLVYTRPPFCLSVCLSGWLEAGLENDGWMRVPAVSPCIYQ